LLAAALPLRAATGNWLDLFNGKDLNGWRVGGPAGSWRVEGGVLVAEGPGSHLFYAGRVQEARFRNFEFEVEAGLDPHADSGVFFHTAYQHAGPLEKGFEIQMMHPRSGGKERQQTGSLYGLRGVYTPLAAGDDWFRLRVAVRGKTIQVWLNDTLLVDYLEPTPPPLPPGIPRGRFLDSGTFALQSPGAGARVRFRSLRVRPLPDEVRAPGAASPAADEVARAIVACTARNIPVVDYHVHLKAGLTLEEALARSRRDGIQYGIALNCGKGFPVEDDAGLQRFLETMRGQPVFLALQAEGREWMDMVSRPAVARFDYVFTDAMTWTDNRGRRMRTWIAEEVGTIAALEEFVDTLVDRTVGILEREPIDIYVNPTFLPAQIAGQYDRLWTEKRMRRVMEAAARNHVAIEINDKLRLPRPPFLRMAKEAGCKFAFGTNNGGPHDLGRSAYGLQMVEHCGLDWRDFFVPGVWWPKAAERKGEALRGGKEA
jgi:hypothetical protein